MRKVHIIKYQVYQLSWETKYKLLQFTQNLIYVLNILLEMTY